MNGPDLILDADLARFLPNPRARRAFRDQQLAVNDSTGAITSLQGVEYLTLSTQSDLTGARYVAPSASIAYTDAGAGDAVTFDLTDTGITAADYGSAADTLKLTVDGKGRISAITAYALDSDNITEGGTHLFYTDARARAAIGGSSTITFNSGSGVISQTSGQAIAALGFTPVQYVAAPATSTSPGSAGQIGQDGSYLYVATGPSAWKRIALVTF